MASQPCSKCLKLTESMCSRCKDSYCSIRCQQADWMRHRHLCFAMPRLVQSALIFAKADLPKLERVQKKPASKQLTSFLTAELFQLGLLLCITLIKNK